ncbi:MAG: peptidoglycan-binding protein, partial [Clostridia bacterium]|nr:peptidoglycan-binding protein [Clostridia bacterium]
MSTGKLQINTYNETIALPLSNIKIQISLSSDPDKIISETITNNSGKSDILELDSPPVEYSLTPNSSNRPY